MPTMPKSRSRSFQSKDVKKYAVALVKSAEKRASKKRSSDEDDEDRPKKKKAKGAVVLSKDLRVQLEANFGKHAPKLIEMFEMRNEDGALNLLKRKLLQTSISLLPYAEKTIRQSKSARGVYQFTTLVSQIREIMGDIESDRDRDLLLKVIDDRVIRPAMMELAQAMMMKHFAFRKDLEAMVKPSEVQAFNKKLQELGQELARSANSQYKQIQEGLEKALKN